MKKFVSLAIALAMGAAVAPALAQTVPPTQNVNAPTSSNNGVSNPVGENTNVQVNNSYSGMNSFGVGIQCATPYLAAGFFNNNTDINGGGGIGVNTGVGGNNTTGATLQVVVPIGGTQGANCTALSNEIVKQRQLDTQITLIQRCADFAKAGITLDARVYPQLASACAGVKVAMSGSSSSSSPSGSSDEAAASLPKLMVYASDSKSPSQPSQPKAQSPQSKPQPAQSKAQPSQSKAQPALTVAAACTSPKELSDRDKSLLEQWKMSSSHQNSALQRSLTAKYAAQLAADCVDPVAWNH